MKSITSWIYNLLHSIFWLGDEPIRDEIKYRVEVPTWNEENAEALSIFLKGYDGSLLAQHMKKHQIEVTEWAVDLTDLTKQNDMKYRAGVAFGVKLAHDYILNLSKTAPKSRKKEVTPENLEKFYASRLGLFKP